MSSAWQTLSTDTGAEQLPSQRAPEFIITTLALPSAFYALFGIAITRGGPEVAQYLLATYGVFAVMGPALFGFGANVSSEREKGWLMLTQVAPTSGMNYILSKLLTTLLFSAVALLPVYALAGFEGGVSMERFCGHANVNRRGEVSCGIECSIARSSLVSSHFVF